MSKVTKFLMATAIALPLASPILAEGTLEGIHHWVSESEVGALKVLTDSLAAKGYTWKDSAVGGLSGANATQALRTRLAAGNPPDTMQLLGYEGIEWANEGALRSLNDLYAKNGWEAAIAPAILPFVKSGDDYFSVPINMHRQNWLWVNKAIFDKYGITEPKSWDELIADGKKLKADGVTAFALSDESWQILEVFEAILTDQNG
ncbi:MAG: ABC transporter substrate-binding protein, partial [Paracoccaceae bacterium]